MLGMAGDTAVCGQTRPTCSRIEMLLDGSGQATVNVTVRL